VEQSRANAANIVSNKRLGDVLQIIKAKQRKRGEKMLAKKFVTHRRKKQIRTARAQADALPGNP
jgi:16S rRNA C1402 N4-methylase RsmH